MADLVADVLRKAAEKEAKFKSIEVEKDIELVVDVGNLLTVDENPLDLKRYKLHPEEYIKNLARDNTQLLFNKLWELPMERVDGEVVAQLPEPKTILPREKPVPKARQDTKWEKFARLKGIQKRKKGRMVWDEQHKEYRPRWGYKRADDETKDWLIEVPESADPFEDQFEKRKKAKKERIAKNELQRLRNIARRSKGKVPGVGLTPTDKPDQGQLKRALVESQRSNASMGKFMEGLPKNKAVKGMGKKRKFQSNTVDASVEKNKSLDILKQIQTSKPILDTIAARNSLISQEERKRSLDKKTGKAGGKKSAAGKKGKRNKGKGIQMGKKGKTKSGQRKGKK